MNDPKRMAGFLLIEVLVAFVILVLGLLALARFHYGALSVSAEAKARTEALSYSQQMIESARNIQSHSDYYSLGAYSDSPAGTEAFSRAMTVNASVGANNYKELTLNTGWTDSRDRSNDVVLKSFIHYEKPANAGAYLMKLSEATFTSCTCLHSSGNITLATGQAAACTVSCCILNAGNDVSGLSSFTAQCAQ